QSREVARKCVSFRTTCAPCFSLATCSRDPPPRTWEQPLRGAQHSIIITVFFYKSQRRLDGARFPYLCRHEACYGWPDGGCRAGAPLVWTTADVGEPARSSRRPQ